MHVFQMHFLPMQAAPPEPLPPSRKVHLASSSLFGIFDFSIELTKKNKINGMWSMQTHVWVIS